MAFTIVAAGCGIVDVLPPELGDVARGDGEPGQRDVVVSFSGHALAEDIELRTWPDMEPVGSVVTTSTNDAFVITPTVELTERWYAVWFTPGSEWQSRIQLVAPGWQEACDGWVRPVYNSFDDGVRPLRVELFDEISGSVFVAFTSAAVTMSERVCGSVATAMRLTQAGAECAALWHESNRCGEHVVGFDCGVYLDRSQAVRLQILSGLVSDRGAPVDPVDVTLTVDPVDGGRELEPITPPAISPQWATHVACPE